MNRALDPPALGTADWELVSDPVERELDGAVDVGGKRVGP